MPDITGQLQKTALNQQSANQARIKELVAKLDQPDAPPEWAELKTLIGCGEEAKPAEGERVGRANKDDDGNQTGDNPEGKSGEQEDTVESLVEANTKDELLDLAENENVTLKSGANKEEIAQAILDKRAAK